MEKLKASKKYTPFFFFLNSIVWKYNNPAGPDENETQVPKREKFNKRIKKGGRKLEPESKEE